MLGLQHNTAANDPITTPPTHVGKFGKAWELPHPEQLTQSDASLASWIVEAPWAHGLWHSYFIYLVHLRPLPGAAAAKIYRVGASHEFGIFAMDQEKSRQNFIDRISQGILLQPINFCAQFANSTDQWARDVVHGAVIDICAGTLSPDTDHLSALCARFGGHMIIGHPDNPFTAPADGRVGHA